MPTTNLPKASASLPANKANSEARIEAILQGASLTGVAHTAAVRIPAGTGDLTARLQAGLEIAATTAAMNALVNAQTNAPVISGPERVPLP